MHKSLTSELEHLQSIGLDAGQVFSGKPSGSTVRGYAAPSAYTPVIDPDQKSSHTTARLYAESREFRSGWRGAH